MLWQKCIVSRDMLLLWIFGGTKVEDANVTKELVMADLEDKFEDMRAKAMEKKGEIKGRLKQKKQDVNTDE